MDRILVGIAALTLALAGCAPSHDPAKYAAGHTVRFVSDTLFERAQLPIGGEAWSPSGRRLFLRDLHGVRIVDAIYPSNTSYQPLPPKQQSLDWSPGDSVLACHLRSPAGSGVPDSIFLLRPGEAPEFLAAQWNVGAVVWLPTGALLSVDCDGQYTLLRPGAANAPADTSQRLWGVHLDHTRGSAGWRGLVSTASAPPGAAPIAGVPGWSTVAFDREVGPWLWWSARSRQFMGMQPNGAGLLRFDPMGRFVAAVPPRELGELYFTSVHDGALVVGVVDPKPFSEEGPRACPAFAWSIEGGWRAAIANLEGGIERASGSPAGDRVLMHTRRGVEFGRLVVDR